MESQNQTDAMGHRSTRGRPAALALVLAMLALLAIATTANAFVARLTETTVSDFDSGFFSYTGLLDIPPDIHSVQLLPVGLTGDWHTSAMTMPWPLANFGSVLSGNRIYVVGGTDDDQDARKDVRSYDLDGGGALSGPHVRTALPEARAAAGVTIHDPDGASPVLYVVGGFDTDFTATNTIYRASINPASGEVGTWVLDDQVLPSALESPVVAVHGDTLYIIGGWDSASFPDVVLDTVYRASIGASGALGELVETSSLVDPLYGGVAIVYDGGTIDTLYLIGGRDQDASTAKVYFADILGGGDLTEWAVSEGGGLTSSGGTLPLHLYGHRGVYRDSQIILTGGVVNAVDRSDAISSTVKVALVDPTNTELRLYDWCEGAPPDCTIGAWQTGGLLPEDRALHGAVTLGDYVYVLGGQDSDGDVRDTIFYGTVDGAGAVYRTSGKYTSNEIDLGQEATLLELEWDTTISRPDEMGLTMQYRYSLNGDDWVEWSALVPSDDGLNSVDITGEPEDVPYFQYRASLTTTATTASPLLNSVHLYYWVPDPDLAVIKDTGTVISAELGSMLAYTITYSNSGGWVAENAVLTEVLPENTTFAGSDAWHQVGATNVYTFSVGDVGRGEVGTAGFRVRVNDEVPPNTEYITNFVSIDYPTMTDFWDNSIEDPFMGDNEYEFGNPLSFHRAVDLAITDLVWYPALTEAGAWPRFCLTVANIGTADALPLADELGFWVELYIKPSPPESPAEPPQRPDDHDWGYCLYDLDLTCKVVNRPSFTRYIPQLLAGEKVEDLCFEPQSTENDPSALDYPEEGLYNVYVQVDVAFEDDDGESGRYLEGNEGNNLVEDTMELIPVVYRVYLPVVLKSAP